MSCRLSARRVRGRRAAFGRTRRQQGRRCSTWPCRSRGAGITVLAFDGPGQAAALRVQRHGGAARLREAGQRVRGLAAGGGPRWTRSASALSRPAGAATTRRGPWPSEKRIKACGIIWCVFDTQCLHGAAAVGYIRPGRHGSWWQRASWGHGQTDPAHPRRTRLGECLPQTRSLQAAPVAAQIRMRLFIVHGANDRHARASGGTKPAQCGQLQAQTVTHFHGGRAAARAASIWIGPSRRSA